MTTLAVGPETQPTERSRKWLYLLIVVVVLLIAAAVHFGRKLSGGSNQGVTTASMKFYNVAPMDLQVKVHKDGELQAVNNVECVNMVEGTSTIVQLIKEGSNVNVGDVLVQLDSSEIRTKIDDYSLELQRAEGDVATAKNALEYQMTQNEATLEAAQVDVELGRLAIQQYVEGTYPQDLETADTVLKMAKIKLENKEADFKQIQDLHSQGFVNLADVKAAELDLATARNDVSKADGDLKVLTKYTHPMMLQGKQSYLKQAEQKLARTKIENNNALNKAKTTLTTQEAQKRIIERKLNHANEQLEYCTIKAPQAGLVVYNNNTNRDSQQPIQEGTPVRERQALLRLPDTSAMKAVVRINENQVIRLNPGQQATVRVTGIRDPIGATVTRISPVADSVSKYVSPDTREYPVELVLDWTPPSLKPGIGVEVEVMVESVKGATAVPLSAIYSAGADTYVFVRGGDGQITPRRVQVGIANETHVNVTEGLAANEQVVLLTAGQGRELLDKAGIQVREEEQKLPTRPEKKEGDAETPAASASDGSSRSGGGSRSDGSSGKSSRKHKNGDDSSRSSDKDKTPKSESDKDAPEKADKGGTK